MASNNHWKSTFFALMPWLAALLCSFCLASATPGLWDFRVAGFVAMIPMYLAVKNGSVLRNFFVGWFAGAAAIAMATGWMIPTARYVFGCSNIMAMGVLSAISLYQGLQFAAASLLFSVCNKKMRPWFVFACSMGIADALFPHLYPITYGLFFYDTPLLLQTADIAGQATITFGMAILDALLAETLLLLISQTRRVLIIRTLSLTGLIVSVMLGYGILRAQNIDSLVKVAPSMQVAVVQPGVFPEEAQQNNREMLQTHVQMSQQVIREKNVDLLIWSESLFNIAMTKRELFLTLHELLRDVPVPVVLGVPIVHTRRKDPQEHFNSVVLAQPDGWICPQCRYDKNILFPVGEQFVSAQNAERNSMAIADASQKQIKFNTHHFAVFVCFEALFPNYVRSLAKGTSLLINPSYDGWFGRTAEPRIHEALSRIRAVENRKPLIRAAMSGISTVIDPVGRVVEITDVGEKTVITSRVVLMDTPTVYSLTGNAIWWGMLLLLLMSRGFHRFFHGY